jgi:two-component system CheB/CheR fusion protein
MKEQAKKKKNMALAVPKDGGDFYIVGMGASAGGLEAFERFFKNMPDDSGMTFNPTKIIPYIAASKGG